MFQLCYRKPGDAASAGSGFFILLGDTRGVRQRRRPAPPRKTGPYSAIYSGRMGAKNSMNSMSSSASVEWYSLESHT